MQHMASLPAPLLPLLPQNADSADRLGDELRATLGHLASAARYGAATSHRLMALAHAEIGKISDADPQSSVESICATAALTKLANDSAQLACNLLNANKETVKRLANPESDDSFDESLLLALPREEREAMLKGLNAIGLLSPTTTTG